MTEENKKEVKEIKENPAETLMALIKDIKDSEETIWNATKAVEEEQADVELEKAKLEQEVNDEKDLVTGKLMYPNAQSRQTALKILVNQQPELQERIQKIKEVRNKLKMDEIGLSSMLRIFSVLKRLLVPEQPIKVDVIK